MSVNLNNTTKVTFNVNTKREDVIDVLNEISTRNVAITLDDGTKLLADRCSTSNNRIADIIMMHIDRISNEMHEQLTYEAHTPTDEELEEMFRAYAEEEANRYDCETATLHHYMV